MRLRRVHVILGLYLTQMRGAIVAASADLRSSAWPSELIRPTLPSRIRPSPSRRRLRSGSVVELLAHARPRGDAGQHWTLVLIATMLGSIRIMAVRIRWALLTEERRINPQLKTSGHPAIRRA